MYVKRTVEREEHTQHTSSARAGRVQGVSCKQVHRVVFVFFTLNRYFQLVISTGRLPAHPAVAVPILHPIRRETYKDPSSSPPFLKGSRRHNIYTTRDIIQCCDSQIVQPLPCFFVVSYENRPMGDTSHNIL